MNSIPEKRNVVHLSLLLSSFPSLFCSLSPSLSLLSLSLKGFLRHSSKVDMKEKKEKLLLTSLFDFSHK